eukprot:1157795-Pelagomonas_calceolata.AAC.8
MLLGCGLLKLHLSKNTHTHTWASTCAQCMNTHDLYHWWPSPPTPGQAQVPLHEYTRVPLACVSSPQEGFQAQDDASASEDVPTTTQNEQEAAIKEMLDKAKAAAEHARQRAATEPSSLPPPPPSDSEEEEQDGEEEGEDNGEDGGEQGGEQQQHGDSGGTANGDGAGPSTTLQLQEGDEQLFEGEGLGAPERTSK